MRAFVGVTDQDWFDFLRARPDLDEVNFWQPSPRRPFSALAPGELFLFKLKYPVNRIVGGGLFLWSGTFPFPYVWDLFEERNGTATLADLRDRLARLRRTPVETWDTEVGCIVLTQPFFLDEEDWIEAPPDWSPNIVRGKGYDLRSFYGQRLLEEVEARARRITARREIEGPMFGDPALVRRRLGQGGFRVLVTEGYERRYMVQSQLRDDHAKPAVWGSAAASVTTIRTAWLYHALEGRELWLPRSNGDHPSGVLSWHNDAVYLP